MFRNGRNDYLTERINRLIRDIDSQSEFQHFDQNRFHQYGLFPIFGASHQSAYDRIHNIQSDQADEASVHDDVNPPIDNNDDKQDVIEISSHLDDQADSSISHNDNEDAYSVETIEPLLAPSPLVIPTDMDETNDKVEIRESTLGTGQFGLFAKKNIPTKTVICFYRGQSFLISPEELKKRPPDFFTNRDFYDPSSHAFIHGSPQSFGTYANDPLNEQLYNARIKFIKFNGELKFCLASTRNIIAGEEIFVNYGNEFWRHTRITPIRLPTPVNLPKFSSSSSHHSRSSYVPSSQDDNESQEEDPKRRRTS
jgi:hypothetical protein